MARTIARISDGNGDELGRVFFDAGWDAYGWSTPDVRGNGPFDTAEEAGEALADELERFKLGGAVDMMLRDCKRHDAA